VKVEGIRAAIRKAFDLAASDATSARADAERALLKEIFLCLMRDGYTLGMAAAALSVPDSTFRSWKNRDKRFAEEIEDAGDISRRWLFGRVKHAVENDTRAATAGLNIAANLYCPELRDSKVTAEVTHAPTAGESKAAILATLNRSKAADAEPEADEI
jgi:hypothetical protein